MTISYSPTLALLVALGACLGTETRSATAECLPFEPDTVELTGVVSMEQRYGPPNYGEDTTKDQRVQVPMLTLQSKIDICGDSKSDVNREDLRSVEKIQLIGADSVVSVMASANGTANVRGMLSTAQSGQHFTPAVLVVTRLDRK